MNSVQRGKLPASMALNRSRPLLSRSLATRASASASVRFAIPCWVRKWNLTQTRSLAALIIEKVWLPKRCMLRQLLGIELEGGAADVAFRIGRAALAGDGREAREHGRLLPDLRENLGLGVAGDVVGHREGAVGTPALGVHAPLRDYLPVEMRHLLDQPDILEQRRAAPTGGPDFRVVRPP